MKRILTLFSLVTVLLLAFATCEPVQAQTTTITKRIIILDANRDSDGKVLIKAVFWLAVPDGSESHFANSTFVSAYRGTSSAELSELRAGEAVERVATYRSDSGDTNAQIRTALQNMWTARQAAFNTKVGSRFNRYGAFWNGTSWQAGP